MKRTLLILLVLLLVMSGCKQYSDDKTPYGLNNAVRPIIVIAINEQGVVLRDAVGNLYVYYAGYYFARVLIKSDLKAGDILVPERKGG